MKPIYSTTPPESRLGEWGYQTAKRESPRVNHVIASSHHHPTTRLGRTLKTLSRIAGRRWPAGSASCRHGSGPGPGADEAGVSARQR
jgi:hypothetical protein